MKLLVINGANINFFGIREPEIYGERNYDTLVNMIADKAKELDVEIEVFHSNHEGAIIDRIQDAYFDHTDGIIINPGAYAHYSYAIRDALASVPMPKIEVHVTDIRKKEAFRHHSVISEVVQYRVLGMGLEGYLEAIDHLMILCKKNK